MWIKADAKDIRPALQHSRSGDWNGDVQLNPSDLSKLREQYDARCSQLKEFSTVEDETTVNAFLSEFELQLKDDKQFLTNEHGKAVQVYAQKHDKQLGQEKLKEMNWAIAECVQMLNKCDSLMERVIKAKKLPALKAPRSLCEAMTDYPDYLLNLFRKKRTAASHVFVVMISDEHRSSKPYAIPVLYVPCKTLRDQQVRDLVQTVKVKLVEKGLTVAGEEMFAIEIRRTQSMVTAIRYIWRQTLSHVACSEIVIISMNV